MATCADVGRGAYPTERAIPPSPRRRARAWWPAFAGSHSTEFLAWEHEGNRAIRSGKWKLVARAGGPGAVRLAADPVELTTSPRGTRSGSGTSP